MNNSKNLIVGTIFDLSKRQNVTFWIGHAAVILATVLGVYLATSEGLKSAVTFHSIVSQEKNFYTLSALKQEVTTNNQSILDFCAKNFVYDESGQMTAHKSGDLSALNWFVWQTMSNATETLELPVDILSDTNKYYLNLTEEMAIYSRSSGYDVLFSGKRLCDLAKETDTTILARMKEQLDIYQGRLASYKNLGKY